MICTDERPCMEPNCSTCAGFRFFRGLIYGLIFGLFGWGLLFVIMYLALTLYRLTH